MNVFYERINSLTIIIYQVQVKMRGCENSSTRITIHPASPLKVPFLWWSILTILIKYTKRGCTQSLEISLNRGLFASPSFSVKCSKKCTFFLLSIRPSRLIMSVNIFRKDGLGIKRRSYHLRWIVRRRFACKTQSSGMPAFQTRLQNSRCDDAT